MKQQSIYRKDSIVITAIEIISELGIQGLTSKEISNREDISEGTLFSHFNNMNEIIIAVLNYNLEIDRSINETVEIKNLSPIDSIKLLASIYSENYENYPESTCLINISNVLFQDEISKRAEEIEYKILSYLKSLIEKAQISKNINPSVDSEVLLDFMIGSFFMIVQKWRKSKYTFNFKESVLTTLDAFLSAFSRY